MSNLIRPLSCPAPAAEVVALKVATHRQLAYYLRFSDQSKKKKRETKKTNICADSVKPVISRADDGQDRLARQVRTQFQQLMMIMLFK